MAVKTNEKDSVIVKGTSSADFISNNGERVTINAGKGDDTIANGHWEEYENENEELVEVKVGGNGSSINAGAGNDSIENYGDDVHIVAGDGNDDILSSSERVTIDGGKGNDSIFSIGENVSINGGAGNDEITRGCW